jgi:hypothetical protein
MDGAWPDDQDQPIVGAMENAMDRVAGIGNSRSYCLASRQFLDNSGRRGKFGDIANSQIIGGFVHGAAPDVGHAGGTKKPPGRLAVVRG